MKWKVTAAERPSGHWRHQDRHIVQNVTDGIAIAVIDGHGESDDTIIRCMQVLPQKFEAASWGDPELTLKEIIHDLLGDTWGYHDGASISLAYLRQNGCVALATLGDTFACAGRIGGETMRFQWLRPHDISGNDAEHQRLKDAGANVKLGRLHIPGGNELSLSRTLGDHVFRDQTIQTPALLSTEVEALGFVILGSDGFFSMSQPEYMNMAWLACIEEQMHAGDILKADFHRLRMRKDDATVVVGYFLD
ncbi:MAG TPA: PP2C family serine/threonine-protein phosphatase [Candidatus Paceibacterota bacterium]|nr:PP2C family serine/threonine-protein phosphatase [Candidatus Paceibacterota bacterium]